MVFAFVSHHPTQFQLAMLNLPSPIWIFFVSNGNWHVPVFVSTHDLFILFSAPVLLGGGMREWLVGCLVDGQPITVTKYCGGAEMLS